MRGEKDAEIPKWNQNPTETIETERRTLALREYASSLKLGRTLVDSLNFDNQEDFLTKELVSRLSVSVLSDHIVDDTYKARYRYSVYASWWQHLKADHAPKWFVKRFPVVKTQKSGYVTVKFDRYAEYPKANVALQSNRQFYEVHLGGFERIYDTVSQTE